MEVVRAGQQITITTTLHLETSFSCSLAASPLPSDSLSRHRRQLQRRQQCSEPGEVTTGRLTIGRRVKKKWKNASGDQFLSWNHSWILQKCSKLTDWAKCCVHPSPHTDYIYMMYPPRPTNRRPSSKLSLIMTLESINLCGLFVEMSLTQSQSIQFHVLWRNGCCAAPTLVA